MTTAVWSLRGGFSARRALFGISPDEARFERRGFAPAGALAQARLEGIGGVFLEGYHAALEARGVAELTRALEQVEAEQRGFAYEGAAMGLALPARLLPWRRRALRAFVEGPARAHVYMAHVGIGWAWAALPLPVMGALEAYDPFHRWLIVDGFGFYHAYFHAARHLSRAAVPARLRGYARRAFDQGLGRGLWFVAGADVARVAAAIAALPAERRADLWAGVGLASTYAGAIDEAGLRALREVAGGHEPQLAQGACFAAIARRTAGNPAGHTARACRALCGMDDESAAEVAALALREGRGAGDGERYEDVRRRIQAVFRARQGD